MITNISFRSKILGSVGTFVNGGEMTCSVLFESKDQTLIHTCFQPSLILKSLESFKVPKDRQDRKSF